MIIKTIKCLTFIPWILYFIEIMLYRIGIIEDEKLDKKKYMKHLNNHMFSSINIPEIVLFFVFLLFMQYKKTIVLEILFPTIYLYLLINFFQSLAKDCKKIKNKIMMVLCVLLTISIIAFFLYTNHLYTTYILMFSSSILSSFIIYIFSKFVGLGKKERK